MLKGLFNYFESLVVPFENGQKGLIPKSLIGFVSYFSHGLTKYFIAVSFLNSLIAIGEALFFVSLGCIVDWTSQSSPHVFLQLYSKELLLMLLCAGVVLPTASVLHSLLIHQTLSSNYSMLIRWQLHTYLLSQSVSFFNDTLAGALANKVMQTSLALRTAVMKLIDVAVHLIVYITTMVIMLCSANLSLCLPLIIWLVFYILSLFTFIPRLRKASKEQANERSLVVGKIVDSYTNISTVKIFGGKGKEKQFAKESMEDFRQSEFKALRILTLFDVSVQIMNYTLLITLVMMSLWLWANYLVTPGAIAIAIAIAIRMINMSRWIMWEVGAVFENIGIVYDGINSVVKPISVQDPKDSLNVCKFDRKIKFEHVKFSYLEGKNVFEDLDFTIHKGEKVGIVGTSGAGKTTLINLLLRFYDVKSGKITIDGNDIRQFKQDDLRELFSVVNQEPSLLHRSIKQNIGYGLENDPDEEELKKVAKQTDSLSFIERLSDYRGGNGFTSTVGDRGVKLSGGQKQKIALARVILRNAPILILDEATSALDSQSERIIQDNLEQVMQGRTVIAIAHRLSTLVKMDRILVLSQGKIVDQGTHKELLSHEGIYKDLWDIQTDGFIKD